MVSLGYRSDDRLMAYGCHTTGDEPKVANIAAAARRGGRAIVNTDRTAVLIRITSAYCAGAMGSKRGA